MSFNFMTTDTIHSDFGAQENKVCHCFHCFPIYLSWSDESDAMILVFWMLSFKIILSLTIKQSPVKIKKAPQICHISQGTGPSFKTSLLCWLGLLDWQQGKMGGGWGWGQSTVCSRAGLSFPHLLQHTSWPLSLSWVKSYSTPPQGYFLWSFPWSDLLFPHIL